MMMSFNEFIHKYNLKNKATSNIKIKQILSSLYLKDVGICLSDGPFTTDVGIVTLHPRKGTHWVVYTQQNFFGSYGVSSPHKLSKYIMKRNGCCFYSEYKIQGLRRESDSYCAAYCLYISSICVSRSGGGGGGLRSLCTKIGYSEPTREESREGTSALAERSRVT